MARELHRWPSPWRPILKPCQFAVKGEPDGASQAIPWPPDRASTGFSGAQWMDGQVRALTIREQTETANRSIRIESAFGRITRSTSCDSIFLSQDGASRNPGAIHFGPQRPGD
jgi:hypothetical protein